MTTVIKLRGFLKLSTSPVPTVPQKYTKNILLIPTAIAYFLKSISTIPAAIFIINAGVKGIDKITTICEKDNFLK